MKKCAAVFVLVLLWLGSIEPALAASPLQETGQADLAPYLDSLDMTEVERALPERTRRALRELGINGPADAADLQTPQSYVSAIGRLLRQSAKQPFQALARVLGAVVLAAFFEALRCAAVPEDGLGQVFGVTAALAVCAMLSGPVAGCVTAAAGAIRGCASFILSFLPVFTGVLTAAGQPATAAACNLFLFWMCQAASQFAANTLVPMVGLYLAVCVAGAAAPELNLAAAAGMVRSVVTWALGLTMTLFVGLLTVSSLVSASGDTLGVKTARFLLGSFVPVVGGTLSDAFTAAQGCLKLLKTTLGVYGVLAVGAMFLPTLCQLAAWYLTTNLSAAAGDVLGLTRIGGLLRAFASALGILLAMVCCFVLLTVVSLTLMMLLGQGG